MTEKYEGMTLNERLMVAELIDEFDAAMTRGDKEAVVGILERIELSSKDARAQADTLFALRALVFQEGLESLDAPGLWLLPSPCVPAPTDPYFNVSPQPESLALAAGSSATIQITGWSTAAVPPGTSSRWPPSATSTPRPSSPTPALATARLKP
jgi:hypothetical protein